MNATPYPTRFDVHVIEVTHAFAVVVVDPDTVLVEGRVSTPADADGALVGEVVELAPTRRRKPGR